MSLFSYPKVEYPRVILGYVHGPVRWENLAAEETFDGKNEWFWNQSRPEYLAIAHQQKMSRFGFLWMSPFCLHAWFFIQLQKKCAHHTWVPGSEFGKYLRFGLWRWDPKKTNGKRWMGPWTFYVNFSFHWD